MFYKQELSFLCDVFKKSRVSAIVLERRELIRILAENEAYELFYAKERLLSIIPSLRARTLYTFKDGVAFSYRFMLLPETEVPTVLTIGPYRTAQASEGELLELGERFGITPQKQKHFAEYYESIPLLPNDSPVWMMLNTFCERIWKSPAFAVEEILPIVETVQREAVTEIPARDDTEVSMKALERRYAFENEMIRAVEKGQLHIEKQISKAFSVGAFEKRTADQLRNAKNYGIIMNTLLRKAAEHGGVHPLYIDRVSSDFARRIEDMASLGDTSELMCEMFRNYCRLVQEQATAGLPEVVKTTILKVNADLSADISPHELARRQGVSLGYLSTVFKRATGQTLSDYIRERRMEQAAHLLTTTSLQIQTVALHCGIMDVQYFSKIFKQQMGQTPSDYRASRRAMG